MKMKPQCVYDIRESFGTDLLWRIAMTDLKSLDRMRGRVCCSTRMLFKFESLLDLIRLSVKDNID